MSLIPFIGNAEAVSLSQFPGPIRPPLHGPNFQTVAVPIACEWIPYVAGACKALLAEAVWDTATLLDLEITLGRVQELLAIFEVAGQNSGCATVVPDFSCPFSFQSFPGDNGGYVTEPQSPYSPDIGIYNDLLGWVGNPSTNSGNEQDGVDIHRLYAASFVAADVTMVYNLTVGTFLVASHTLHTGIQLFLAGVMVAQNLIFSDDDTTGDGKAISVIGSFLVDEIRLVVHSGWNPVGTGDPGFSAITDVNIDIATGGCP